MPTTRDAREPSDPALREKLRAAERFVPDPGDTLAETIAPAMFRELADGEVFASKYAILQRLGSGGMSVVYKAKDIGLRRIVALKVLRGGREMDSGAVRRFQQEARAASRLNHEGIVGVHDFGVAKDGPPYLVLEYVEGQSIAELLEQTGIFSKQRTIDIMLQACDALSHAHAAGVIHRDIKPSNMMLCHINGKEMLRFVDFGIAKIEKLTESAQKLTQTGEIFGSPLYMAPEQCLGKAVDGRADIYSLGCVMYEMLTGAPPLIGENAVETIYKHLQEQPIPLSKAQQMGNANLSKLEGVVMRCLEKDPDKRFTNLQELHTALNLVASGKSVPALSFASGVSKRNMWLIGIPCVLFVVALGLTWWLASHSGGMAPGTVRSEKFEQLKNDAMVSLQAGGFKSAHNTAEVALDAAVSDEEKAEAWRLLAQADENLGCARKLVLDEFGHALDKFDSSGASLKNYSDVFQSMVDVNYYAKPPDYAAAAATAERGISALRHSTDPILQLRSHELLSYRALCEVYLHQDVRAKETAEPIVRSINCSPAAKARAYAALAMVAYSLGDVKKGFHLVHQSTREAENVPPADRSKLMSDLHDVIESRKSR